MFKGNEKDCICAKENDKHKIRQKSKSPVAMAKGRIQALLREIAGVRQNWICWVENYPVLMDLLGPHNEVWQYDHVNTRARNISYGDSRLGVGVCKRHHWFHDTSFDKEKKAVYEKYLLKFIGPENRKLYERVKADKKTYNFQLHNWLIIEAGLKQELEKIKEYEEK